MLSGAFLALAGLSLAQGTFTIRRPANGSSVRETVAVRLPKNSIGDGEYIGVYVDGKFLEAVMPDPDTKTGEYVYKLDTKARNLTDGEHTIEVVKFVDLEGKPRIVNRSSVQVTVSNHSDIKINPNGELLRYRFPVGKEWKYNVSLRTKVSRISQALAQVGGRPDERDLGNEKTRLMYAIDNNYGNEGLVRIQGLPDKGKDYTIVTVNGANAAGPRFNYEMHPIYMRVTTTGREVFSSAPPYFPLEGTAGDPARSDLFYVFPLPVLPAKAQKPGDVWNAPFQIGALNLDKKDEEQKYTASIDSRGSFEGVEWYRGRRTAKIRMMVAVGPEVLTKNPNVDIDPTVSSSSEVGQAAKVEIEQLIWFDLDRGMIVRMDRSATQESIIETAVPTAGGGFSGQGGAPSAAGVSGAGGGGRRGGPPRMGGMSSNQNYPGIPNDFKVQYRPTIDGNGNLTLFQQFGAPGGRGQRGGPSGGSSGMRGPGAGFPGGSGVPNGPGGFQGFNPGGASGGGGSTKQVQRISSTISIELE